MIEIQTLKKIDQMLALSIQLMDVDCSSTLIISRKILESICKTIYDKEKIDLPVGADGYTTIDLMLKDLLTKKIISTDIYKSAEFVRKNGNQATHHFDVKINKNMAKAVIKNLSTLLEWFLRKYEEYNNSLYFLVSRHSQIGNKNVDDNEALDNFKVIREFLKASFFKNPINVIDLYNDVGNAFFVDKELLEYFDITYTLSYRFYKWKERYDRSKYEQGFIEKILYGKSKVLTPKESFMVYHRYQVESQEELREKLKKRYLIR